MGMFDKVKENNEKRVKELINTHTEVLKNNVSKYLSPNEEVIAGFQGTGIDYFVVTNKKVIFVDNSITTKKQTVFIPLKNIDAVGMETKIVKGEIKILSKGREYSCNVGVGFAEELLLKLLDIIQ